MAHLIDGYQMMLSQQPSLWSVQDLFTSENTSVVKTRRAQTLSPQVQRNQNTKNNIRLPLTPNFNRSGPTFDQNSFYYSRESNSEDYAKSMISESEFHLDRSSVRLEELIGDGLFGNVYRGSYVDTRLKRHSVAVKVCRVDIDSQDLHTSNKYLLEEAYTMQQFRHPHIIKLLGICSGPSISSSDESDSGTISTTSNNNNDIPAFGVWMVMELAPFGELRQYLQREKSIIDLSVQILFAKQIASAVTYLHSRAFVHRDIAARNVLVTNSRCVKLSDFGMSKLLAEEEVYTSSSGKLPIKWMAPESLNFRKFTTQSDVYSLGICIWEILMHGIKPWQGIRNHEVIKKIEVGEILHRPPECPLAVYDMLRAMWVIDEYFRITAIEATHFLEHLLEEIDDGKKFCELSVPDFHTLRKKIDALPKSNASTTNGRKKSVPILNVDASEVPFSTLWRTMESQRQQCEEDEKWLEGEEEGEDEKPNNNFPSTSSLTTKISPIDDLNNQHQQKPKNTSPPPLPKDIELNRASDSIHEAVLRVVQAVTHLTKTYSTQMTNNEFVEKIKKITNELSRLFSESVKDIQKLGNDDRKKVEMVEALLGADLRNMTKAMSHVVDESEKVNIRKFINISI
uniref:Protein kinase domain-containing protein n=1 Tax=Panagrolaimus sp. ES5 TaxID=591445 RepID=A0AC34FV90_9BILA